MSTNGQLVTRWDIISGFILRHTANGIVTIQHADGCYWHFNGKYYQRCSDDDIAQLLSAYCEANGFDVTSSLRDDYLKDVQRKVATKATQHNAVAFRNCLVDPLTMQAQPLAAKTFSRFVLPYIYEPTAQCPQFMQFLQCAVPNAQSRVLLQQAIGGLLWPTNPWSYAVFLIGSGNNGKSTLFHTCEQLVGREHTCYRTLDTLFDKFGLVEVQNRLLNIIDEMDSKELRGKAMRNFKIYTGGNQVSADVKFAKGINFKPTAKLFIGSNYAPEAKDSSEGFWRRVLLIRLPVVIPTDYSLWNKIDSEIQGIANWALQGLQSLLTAGNQGFVKSAEDTALKEAIRMHNNPMPWFVLRHLEYANDPQRFLSYEELNVRYLDFINAKELPNDWSSQKCRQYIDTYWPRALPCVRGGDRGFKGLQFKGTLT